MESIFLFLDRCRPRQRDVIKWARLCEEQLVILLGAPGGRGESEASLEGFGQEAWTCVFPASSDGTWALRPSYAASGLKSRF